MVTSYTTGIYYTYLRTVSVMYARQAPTVIVGAAGAYTSFDSGISPSMHPSRAWRHRLALPNRRLLAFCGGGVDGFERNSSLYLFIA